MTRLIFDWTNETGPAKGTVTVERRTWRRDPETLHVPWRRRLTVDGSATLDAADVAGEVLKVRWTPAGNVAARTDHILVPDDGEHLAHLLPRVDKDTLAPDAEPDAVWDARADAQDARLDALAADVAAIQAAPAPSPAPTNLRIDADGALVYSPGADDVTLSIDPDGALVAEPK